MASEIHDASWRARTSLVAMYPHKIAIACHQAPSCRCQSPRRRPGRGAGVEKAQGVAMVESMTRRSDGDRPRAAATDAASRAMSCARTSGFVKVSANTNAVSGPMAPSSRLPVAIVHNRHRAADAGGEPFEIGARLVVDLPHQHGMAILRHQRIEDQRRGLHARIAGERRSGVLQRPQAATAAARGGRPVPRVEGRQRRPAGLGKEHRRGLAFLPFDDPRRSEQVELNGRVVRVQERQAGRGARARRATRAARASPRSSRPEAGGSGGQVARIQPLGHAAHSRPPGRGTPSRAPGARRLRERARSPCRVLAEIMNATWLTRVLGACGVVLHAEPGATDETLDPPLEPGVGFPGHAQVMSPRERRRLGASRAADAAGRANAPSCPAPDQSDRRAPPWPWAGRPRPCRTG